MSEALEGYGGDNRRCASTSHAREIFRWPTSHMYNRQLGASNCAFARSASSRLSDSAASEFVHSIAVAVLLRVTSRCPSQEAMPRRGEVESSGS